MQSAGTLISSHEWADDLRESTVGRQFSAVDFEGIIYSRKLFVYAPYTAALERDDGVVRRVIIPSIGFR